MTTPADFRLVMMGTGTFAEPTFLALLGANLQVVGLITQPDRVIGEQRGSTRQVGLGMKQIAVQHRIPIFQPDTINSPEGEDQLKEWHPDLLVVAAYGQILSRGVLTIPTQGGINVHASLLPKYRGAAPIAWAIWNGEEKTGVTIIKMSVALDAGAMLAQAVVDILPDETAGELESRLGPIGGQLALQVIDQMAAGTAQGLPQDKSQVTKAPKLTKEMGLIDWRRHGREVCYQIRAVQPWPTPYTFLHEKGRTALRLIVPRATWAATETNDLAPGQLLLRADAPFRLVAAAGSGSIVEILEVQPAGKRRMSAEEFLRGHRLQPGDFLGPDTP